jgi:chemotaxis protein methyltransferase CheR
LPELTQMNGDDLPEAAFAAILTLLRERRQFDLHPYKDRCIRRRIAKRLRASGASDIDHYLEQLAGNDDELDLLLATLSIHVSQFFRNPEVFRTLERQLLPDFCRQMVAAGRTELRLWSAGCAGGEEAYSLALLIDALAPTGLRTTILATDISEPTLEQAREGCYPAGHLADVPAAVRSRYFQAEAGRYRLDERIRGMVDFRRHNLITASGYPPVDLIVCRNVLIYFTREEQSRILARFAAALPAGGVLVLGRTEALPRTAASLFRAEFPTERIYRRLVDTGLRPGA